MDRDERAPATGFSGEFWDTVHSDWLRPGTVAPDDDDEINVRLSWFQSHCGQQLQLTPPIDTGSSHSDDSQVSHHRFRPIDPLKGSSVRWLHFEVLSANQV